MEKINKSLSDTTDILHRSLVKLSKRGFTIERIEMDSEALLQSSNSFISFFDPWYIRIAKSVFCCKVWWCQFHLSQEESGPQALPWAKL